MTTTLDVVNDCLAIMGEAPLTSMQEEHALKPAVLRILERNDKTIQSEGWWFNTEVLELLRNELDGRVYLPQDGSTIRPGDGYRTRYVQRGRTLYDLENGTNLFPEGWYLKVNLIRRVPFADLPASVSAYIARKCVMDFQQEIDGDQTKQRNLSLEVFGNGQSLGLHGLAKAEHIRNISYNFADENNRLSGVRNVVNYQRRPWR